MKKFISAMTLAAELILVCGVAATPLFASTVHLGTLTQFTGGDAGEGLDLSGNIVYAFNLGPGATQIVQGVTFAAAPVGTPPAGIATTTSSHFDYSTANPGGANGADYGATADDDSLETIVNTVWYGTSWTFDLAVTPGTQYQLQLILQESFWTHQGGTNRNFDVSVETASPDTLSLAVDELVLGAEANGANQADPDFGLVYTYVFTASDSSFRVALDDSPNGNDTFAVLGAVTLEELPGTTTPAVILDGSTSVDSIAANAPVGTRVGVLSMVNTNAAGFTYALNSGGDTNFFGIPAGTSNLVAKAALGVGPYDLKIEGTKGGFSVTNDFTITVTVPVIVSLSSGTVFHEAPVGTTVGTLSMANAASQAGFVYSLHPSGDTTHFAISDTNKLMTAASLTAGTYGIVVLATNANDGFWVTNGLTIAAVSDFDDFSTDPNIGTEWTQYSYFRTENSTPTWDDVDQDLDLDGGGGGGGAVLGLYRTGVTRAATDTVTMTVKELGWTPGTWGYSGLMITAAQQQNYITGTGDSYAFVVVPMGGGDFRFDVRGSYGDFGLDFIFHQGTPQTFTGPYVLDIERVGDNYVFKVDGVPLYTTGDNPTDTYGTASKDSMIYYQITHGGDGPVTSTVDDFGVLPDANTDLAVTLDGSTTAGSIASNAPVGAQVGVLSMINTNPAGFAYSLDAGGDTTYFDIPGGTSNLVTKAALGAGPYGVKIVGSNGVFSVTNDFEITVAPPITVDLSNTGMTANAAVGAQVGTLSMANAASQAGFTYALDPSGDTTRFAISNTNKLVTAASLAVGSYDIVIRGTNATDGFWVTNAFTIGVTAVGTMPEPVQYWPFDDGSGTTAVNVIEGGSTGMLVNTPTWITTGLEPKLTSRGNDPSTAALDFDPGATADYVDGGNINLTSSSGRGEVTVSMWLNPDTLTGDDRIFSPLSGAASQAGAVGEGQTAGVGGLWVWNGAGFGHLTSAGALSVGSWQHLALVWDSGRVTAYLDGVEQLTATANFDFGAANGNFGIAARFVGSYGDGFDGRIDDVAIYDVALTPGQVTALANGDAPVASGKPGLIILIR